MKPTVRWVGIGVAAILGLGLAGFAYVYIASELIIGRHYPLSPSSLTVATDAGTIARGHHVSHIYGCTDCHGADLRGRPLESSPVTSRNLTLLAAEFSDADFDRAVRHGIRPDGTSVHGDMPSDSYQFMADADAASIVSYIRSLRPAGASVPEPEYDLESRWNIVSGEQKLSVAWFPRQLPALDLGPAHARAREMLMSACGECHTTSLGGEPGGAPGVAPDLAIVASYERDDFVRLMRTGKAAGNRELTLMSQTARRRFSHFTDEEINAIYDYLALRGQRLTGGGG